MTRATSSAEYHWTQARLPSVMGLEILLEQTLQRFLVTTAETLHEDLRYALRLLAGRLQSPRQVLFLCPQDDLAYRHCVVTGADADEVEQQRMTALCDSRERWRVLAGNHPLMLEPSDPRDACRALQADMHAGRILLVPVNSGAPDSGCLLLALNEQGAVPSAAECSLLSTFVQLCYLVADRLAVMSSLQQREKLLQQTECLAGLGRWHDDVRHQRITCSAQTAAIFGLPAERNRVTFESFLQYVHPDDRQKFLLAHKASCEQGIPSDMVYRICPPSGEVKVIHVVSEVMRDEHGQITDRIGSVQDITELYERESRLKQAARVFESTMEGVLITSSRGMIEAVNPAFTTITGYGEDEVRGRPVTLLNSRRHDKSFFRNMLRGCARHGFWRGEIWNRRKNGEVFPQWLTVTTIRDEQQQISQYVAVFADMSRIRRSEQQVDYLASHDPLTGLPNRLSLLERLQKAMTLAAARKRRLAVINIDLDHFKHINDSLGHPAGDRLLRACARRLRERLRDSDIVARPGGDEFLVVLEDVASQAQVERLVVMLQELFAGAFDVGTGHELYISASFGVTLYPDHGQTVTQLLSNADVAMYCAKKCGRNHYQFYTSDMTQAASDRLELGSQLRHALQGDDELLLWYQPQVDIQTGQMVGAEALLRWQHPEKGLIQPGRFLPVAEDNSLMPEVDRWVLTHTCRQLASWQQAGIRPFAVAVNISQPTFIAGGLPERLEQLLAEYELDPRWLELEITEGALLEPTPQVLNTIARLKAMGISLAVDDFGTGYSSLAYLHRYRVDKLKIDRRFVSSVGDEEEGRVITRTIMSMARELGLAVLAEGVETEEQLDFIRANGCQICQGYYFSRPLPVAEFGRWLQ